MWKRYPWVQLYDNTYSTNNKGLALFQIVHKNHLGKSVSCAFGLIDNEREEGFNWHLDKVNEYREEIGAQRPTVTITDFEKAMRSAITRVYPDAHPQLCIFHISKNVVLNFKKKWNKAAAKQVARAQARAQDPGA